MNEFLSLCVCVANPGQVAGGGCCRYSNDGFQSKIFEWDPAHTTFPWTKMYSILHNSPINSQMMYHILKHGDYTKQPKAQNDENSFKKVSSVCYSFASLITKLCFHGFITILGFGSKDMLYFQTTSAFLCYEFQPDCI